MSSSDAAGLSRMMNAMSTPLRSDACAKREAQLTFERFPSGLQWDGGVWQRATTRSAAEQCLCCAQSAQTSQRAAARRQGEAAWSGLLGHSQVARSGETQHTRGQQGAHLAHGTLQCRLLVEAAIRHNQHQLLQRLAAVARAYTAAAPKRV